MSLPKVLTIAGSDPSGGAGIEGWSLSPLPDLDINLNAADLKVFTAHGCYGMTTITALTAQNTQGVRGIHVVPPEFVRSALTAVLEDISPDVIKTGMLATKESIEAVMDVLDNFKGKHRLVVDPVRWLCPVVCYRAHQCHVRLWLQHRDHIFLGMMQYPC